MTDLLRPAASPAPVDPVRLETWPTALATARAEEVLDVYREAFLEVFEADPARAVADRRAHVHAHLSRPEVTLVAAVDATGRLVGMTYVAPGRRGVWWHDVVAGALGREAAADWLGDVVEVVELHVRPAAQGRGLGRALLRAGLAQVPTARTAALSALDDPALPARRLYAAEGFVPLLEHFRFPGSPTRYAVLGKRLS